MSAIEDVFVKARAAGLSSASVQVVHAVSFGTASALVQEHDAILVIFDVPTEQLSLLTAELCVPAVPHLFLVEPDTYQTAVDALQDQMSAFGEHRYDVIVKSDPTGPIFANTVRHAIQRYLAQTVRTSPQKAIEHAEEATRYIPSLARVGGESAQNDAGSDPLTSWFMTLAENMRTGVILQDDTYGITYVNQAFSDMVGYERPHSFADLECNDVFAAINAVACRSDPLGQILERRHRATTPIKSEQLPCIDGRTLEFDYIPVCDETACRGALWLWRDVTEKRDRAEAKERALEERRRQQRTLMELATHPALAEGRLETALPLLTETIASILQVERVDIWRVQSDGKYHCLEAFQRSEDQHTSGETLSPEKYPRYFETLKTERVVDARDVTTDPRTAEFNAEYWLPHGIVSALDAVVRLHGRVVGMICHEHTERRDWTPDEIALAGQVADLVAQVYLHAETRQRLQEIALLSRVINATASATDLRKALDDVCRAFADFFEAPRCAFAILNEHDSSAEIVAEYRTDTVSRSILGERIPSLTPESVRQFLRHKKPLAISDAQDDARLAPLRGFTRRHQIVSLLIVPIVITGQIAGIFGIDARTHRVFTDDELALAENVARQVSQALHRLRLFTAMRTRVALKDQLAGVAADLNRSFTVDEAIERIGEGALTLSSADRVAVYLREQKDTFTCGWSHGLSESYLESVQTFADELPGSRLFSDGRPIKISDVHELPAFDAGSETQSTVRLRQLAEQEGYRSVALWPLVHEGRTLAALGCYYDTPQHWSPAQEDVMQTYARQAAIALESARLFEAEREQRRLAEALREVGDALSASLEVETVLDRILEEIERVVPYDSANVMLVEDGVAYVTRTRGYEQLGEDIAREIRSLSFEVDSTRNLHRMAETGKPFVISDTRTYDGWMLFEANKHIRSWAGAPIIIQGEVIAFFEADKREPNFYQPEHAERLAIFAGQAALALQNARLYEAERKRRAELEAVREASLRLTANLDLSSVLKTVLEQTLELVEADAAHIFLYDEGQLHFGASLAEDEFRHESRPQPHDDDLAYAVARSGTRIVIPDMANDPAYETINAGGAIAGLPLRIGNTTLGVMNVVCDVPHDFTEDELRILELLADQATIALENAHLFEALENRISQLSTLADASVGLRAAATVDEIGPVLAQQAGRLVRADAALVVLFDRENEAVVVIGSDGLPETIEGRWPVNNPIFYDAVVESTSHRAVDLAGEPLMKETRQVHAMGPALFVPLRTSAGDVIGTLLVARDASDEHGPAPFRRQEERVLTTLAEIAANTLERAQAHEDLETAYMETVLALAKAVDARDEYTSDHSQMLAVLAEATARELGLDDDQCAIVRWAALLHDIGKIGVPDRILRKPGPLTAREWDVMKLHPEIGAEIVGPVKQLEKVAPLIRAHQERYDGSGYPDGLKGDEIPLGARILAVVDAYSAITDDRVYGRPQSHEQAVTELRRCAGTQFDPVVVEAFLAIVDRFRSSTL